MPVGLGQCVPRRVDLARAGVARGERAEVPRRAPVSGIRHGAGSL